MIILWLFSYVSVSVVACDVWIVYIESSTISQADFKGNVDNVIFDECK